MIYIGPGVIGLLVWLFVWLVLGHFWIGVIAGIIIACCAGGLALGRGGRGPGYRS